MNKFSIILPVRNGGEYVKECINSILSQTYSNFNVIVLDNNSTDGTNEWISELKNEKIIIIPSTKDLTIEQNWGRIKDIEKNEFITLIGHDDLLNDTYLEEMNWLINEFPDASLYHTHFNYINYKGDVLRACKTIPQKIDENLFIELFLKNKMDSMGTGYLMKSKDYNKVGGIPTHYPSLLFADFELWLNLCEISYLVVSPKKCFSFRIHQSTTTTSGNTKYLNAFEVFINYLSAKTKNNLLNETINKNILSYISLYCQSLTHRLIKTPSNKRAKGESVKNILYKCKQYAHIFLPNNEFNPSKNAFVKLALLVDSTTLTQKLFLFFKKIVKMPILK